MPNSTQSKFARPEPEGQTPSSSGLFVDLRPLKMSPDYRRLWLGGALSGIGSGITAVAVPIQVYDLTHSSLAVGLLGLAIGAPMILLGLFGGALADTIDRRKLVLASSGSLMFLSLILALQSLLKLNELWLLYVLVFLQSCIWALSAPAGRAMVPRLVPRDQIAAASALSQLSFQSSLLLGPLLAGAIVATGGLQAAYLTDAATFIFALYAVFRLPAVPAKAGSSPPGPRAVIEGLRFIRKQPVLATVLLVDLNAMVFGMPRALFPALAATHFGGGAETVGVLYAAPALGGILGAMLSAPLTRVSRQGLGVLVAAGVWGLAISVFALTSHLWLSVFLLAIAGIADMVTGVFRRTILQEIAPDSLRGRVNSVGIVVGVGAPRLGDLEAGVVAAFTSPVISAFTGGLACVVAVAGLGLAFPSFARYNARARDNSTAPVGG